MKEQQLVRDHFDRTWQQFDSIYSGEKTVLRRKLDGWLRWDMQERLRLTLEACQPLAGKRILDVGCGTGRYCFLLAEGGAAEVVGIDFAPRMIAAAREIAGRKKSTAACRFLCADILAYQDSSDFDHVIAVGLFDYIKDSQPLLMKLRKMCGGTLIATFPRANTWRAPLRKIRLTLMGCPVHFYTQKRIQDHLRTTGFMPGDIKQVGKLYFLEAR